MFLSRWAINRPVATLTLMLAVMMLGAVSLANLQLDILPKINPPVMTVITELPGATAEEVLTLITEPLEGVAATVSGIETLRSISREGNSVVILQFDWDVELSEVRTELAEKLDMLPLPEDAGRPQIIRFDPTQMPLLQVFATAGDQTSIEDISEHVAQNVKPRLEAVPGVAEVRIVGGISREVRVELDIDQLYAHQLGVSRIAGMVAGSSTALPLGVVTDSGARKHLRLPAAFNNIDQLRQLPVSFVPSEAGLGEPVELEQLGRVEETLVEGGSVTRLNANPAVGIQIQKDGTGNTAAVARAVRQELEDIREEDGGMDLAVALDQGLFIEESLQSSAVSLIAGGFFAMAVLLAFLGSLLSTLIIAVAIPFSIIATFILMFAGGMSLNIMTLGGLALGVGMFVDNSIVVIENIYRHLQEDKGPAEAARDGSGEVAGAITAATLTTIVVFLPVIFVGGLTGTLFQELALTVTFALLSSLVVSLTVIPMLASRWLRKFSAGEGGRRFKKRESFFGRLLHYSLRHKWLVLGMVVLLLALSTLGISRIGTEFLPAVDEQVFTVDLQLPVETPLDQTAERVREFEAQLLAMPEVRQVTALVGGGAGFSRARSALQGTRENSGQLIVALKEDAPPTLAVMHDVREKFMKQKNDDEELAFNLHSSLFFAPGSSANLLQLTLTGPEFAQLRSYAAELVDSLADVKGLTGTESAADDRLPEIRVVLDNGAALRSGLVPQYVGDEVRAAIQGRIVGRIPGTQDLLNVRVRLQREDTDGIEAIRQIPLQAQNGLIPLQEIAAVEEGFGPAAIIREEQKLTVDVSGQVENRDIGSVLADALKRADELDLAEGYEVQAAGTAQLMQEGFASLQTAFILSLALIYLVMAAQFESLKAPLVILFTAPLAVIGVVAALLLTNTSFGITAYIGLIVLGGIVVNNGIVLVDFMQRKRRQGASMSEAVTEAVHQRTRPVLMTAFTTILGLLPLAASLGDGAELQAPLARTVIGGLLSSTMLTLVIVPLLYAIFHRKENSPAQSGTE
ncbi:efflux RND transporter permease subunit [Dethiobacter alkaliphilus]|uniref:Acriflavin resistance protein n=1 Tax=Dethiobacter alkaliphilus AHT 1 TaxID=555088 RepID=C0GHS7_DETAL|nr:efflux RND transporter permease subunit [Dethiobacter alkaliphilus]EEG77001.1 acriflavin resistance protein [Dethiobacter alkaliphilus AHT 1]